MTSIRKVNTAEQNNIKKVRYWRYHKKTVTIRSSGFLFLVVSKIPEHLFIVGLI